MEPDMPLITSKSKGGTMLMWRDELTPYIKILKTASSDFIPVILSIPGTPTTAQICIYLPTSGKEPEFVSALASLDACLEMISEDYACPIYIRGDANVNPGNQSRAHLFQHFLERHHLSSLDLLHPTHHHFVGDGAFDVQLDVLLHTDSTPHPERLSSIICKLENPLVGSHHDLILSTFALPIINSATQSDNLVKAPKIPNDRVKILWDDENIPQYQSLLGTSLSSLRQLWADSDSPTSISVLLQATNDALVSAAKATNKFTKLGEHKKTKPDYHPDIKAAQSMLLQASSHLSSILLANSDNQEISAARDDLRVAKNNLRSLRRSVQSNAQNQGYQKLFNIMDKNPSAIFKTIRSSKSSSSRIQKLHVGNKTYSGDTVCDGFYDSLSSLKAPDMSHIHNSPAYSSILTDYDHIIKICRDSHKIPQISPVKAMEILNYLKPDVNDLYSITARHFINAGMVYLFVYSYIIARMAKRPCTAILVIELAVYNCNRDSSLSYLFLNWPIKKKINQIPQKNQFLDAHTCPRTPSLLKF